jgi:hypothetical protein
MILQILNTFLNTKNKSFFNSVFANVFFKFEVTIAQL